MPTKRFSKKYWKMVIVLITLCAALLILRWAAILWGLILSPISAR
ncbi:small membrane protein YniD [Leclercia adecarboxylata]